MPGKNVMKEFVQSLHANPNYAKVLQWGKLATIAGSAQILVQATGLISGILVIRLLPTHEYALYTLANTMFGAMIVLADGGIGTGVMAHGSKVWQDREKLGVVMATGMDLRRKFTAVSFLVATPVLLYMLLHHGASWYMAIAIFLSLVPGFFPALSGTLLQIAPKLYQDIVPLQTNQVMVNIGRLLMIPFLFFLPWAFVALLAAGLPQIYANIHLKKIADRYANRKQDPDPVIRKDILAIVKRTLPDSIYYCLSGQITVWIISIFGTTSAVAEVGALGRLAMIINLVNALFASLIVPRFARLPLNAKLLISRYFQIQLFLLALCLGLVGTMWLFSSEVLWVIGPEYSNLNFELVLNMIGNCVSFIAAASFLLCTSRGWVINPTISIPISILSIICGALLIDVSTLQGILTLNIFVASIQVLMHGTYSLIKLRKVVTVEPEPVLEM